MRKIIPCLLFAGAALAAFLGMQFAPSAQAGSARVTPVAQAHDDATRSARPVVIELFTSQGCSSCPPADLLASRLAKDGSLLVITRPVTYWDRLGWKDMPGKGMPARASIRRRSWSMAAVALWDRGKVIFARWSGEPTGPVR